MKRSGGVTASAVIAFIGSGVSIVFGGLILASLMMMRGSPGLPPSDGPPVPAPPLTALLVMSLFYVVLGGWGIASGVGLLRLRNWARICFLVFAGLLMFFSFSCALGFLVAIWMFPKIIPPGQNVPAGLMTGIFLGLSGIALVLAALGVWWLFYFNSRSVKSQFLTEAEVAAPRIFPLSITIVAWILIVGGTSIFFGLLSSYPTVLLGFIVRGWTARLVILVLGLVSLLAGIGILRRRPAAHSLAVGYHVFGLLNLSTYFIFGSRMRELAEEITRGAPQSPAVNFDFIYPFMWFGILLGALGSAISLWFLMTRRQAFLDAVRTNTMTELKG